jgi:hypothetical protein
MRKLALLAATCLAALAATGAGAAAPERITIPIQDTFFAPFLSDACGVPVTITIQGTARVLLERNGAGLVVREHDVLSSFTAVFESPADLGGTGRSFTNRSPGVATFDYGAGATIGSTALIKLTGLAGHAAGPGSAVSAGLQLLTGTVIGFSPEGVPIVDFDGPLLVEHGRWPAFDLVLAQRCEALGGSLQL